MVSEAVARVCAVAWLLLGVSCTSVYRPAAGVPDEAGLVAAAEALGALAHAEGFELVEGGISVEAFVYEERDRIDWQRPWPDEDDLDILRPPGPRWVRDRQLVGPLPFYIPFSQLAWVRAEKWPRGAGIAFALDGGDEVEGVVRLSDFERARELADALDLLRRARRTPVRSPDLP